MDKHKILTQKEKGRYMTHSYDKNSFTNKHCKKDSNNPNPPPKVWWNNDGGTTLKDGHLERLQPTDWCAWPGLLANTPTLRNNHAIKTHIVLKEL